MVAVAVGPMQTAAMLQQDVEKVPSGAFSTTQAENAISVLLTKSIHYEVMIDFGRPSMGSSRLFFNSLLEEAAA